MIGIVHIPLPIFLALSLGQFTPVQSPFPLQFQGSPIIFLIIVSTVLFGLKAQKNDWNIYNIWRIHADRHVCEQSDEEPNDKILPNAA